MATETGRPAGKGKAPGTKNIAPELWKTIEDYYEIQGLSPSQIQRKTGVNRRTISNHLLRKGFVRHARAGEHRRGDIAPADALELWRKSAHPAQLPPPDPWATWLFQGGRGAGKTRAGAEWLAAQAAEHGGVYALIGATMRDVREVMIDGTSGLMHLPNRTRPRFEAGRQRLVWDNGAVAYAFSSQEPERLRGPQFDGAWADEFCAWKAPTKTLDVLRFALRRGDDPRLVVTTTPKPIVALRTLRGERSCVVTHAATDANAQNLSPPFVARLMDIYAGTTLARQELDGLIVEGAGALWKAKDFEAARGSRPVEFDRVVVAVDPPAGEGGSACGIVVAGRKDRQAYVLADRTLAGASPLQWARAAMEAAQFFGAREIVAEANQGGAMVRTTLASAGVDRPIRLVHAREGKRARAEPVAALYEQGRVTHVGAFPALEEELMALGEAEMEGMLDRADALVWAVTWLMVETPGPAAPRLTGL